MHLIISKIGLLFLLHHTTAQETKCGDIWGAASRCTCQNRTMDCSGLHIDSFPTTIDTSVEILYLNDNAFTSLSQLPEGTSLTTLSMANNDIKNLAYDTFDNLGSLTTLTLSNNSISTLVDDIFEWNPLKLQILHLDGNKMEFVQHFLFYDLEELTTLHLQRNTITFIHPHAFLQLKSLRNLRLEENQLHTFNPKWIDTLASNAFLELRFDDNPWSCDCAMNTSWSWMREKRAEWFKALTTDHPIKCKRPDNLAGRVVQTLHQDDFQKKCDPPIIVGISANVSVFAGRDVLMRCASDTNRIPVPEISWIAPNGDTYRLDTAANFKGISVHQDGSLLITNVTKSDDGAYTCEATNIVGTVYAITHMVVLEAPQIMPATPSPVNMRELVVPDNIETLPAGSCPETCQCVSRHVDCTDNENNKQSEIPGGMPSDAFSINFASNALKSLEANVFRDYEDLKELRLDDNNISSIDPDAFARLYSLEVLTLRDNELTEIRPRTFSPLGRLNVLVLDQNKLTELNDDTFVGLENVQWLYIRTNRIQTISDLAFKPLRNIKFIHLESNLLQVLHLEAVTTLTSMNPLTIRKIFVDDNLFDCNCHMEEMRQFVRSDDFDKQYPELFADGVVCLSPSLQLKKNLKTISKKLYCTEELSVIAGQKNKAQEERDYWLSLAALVGGIALGVISTTVAVAFRSYVVPKARQRKTRPFAGKYKHLPKI